MADGAAGFGQDSSGPALLRIPPSAPRISRTGLSPTAVRLSRRLPLSARRLLVVLQPPGRLDAPGLGSAAFARHYSRYHCCFLFLPLLGCFGSGGSPPLAWMAGLLPAGLPHSDIQGSRPICGYPWLFAACHVLHRLREPRHPPRALGYFAYPNDNAAAPRGRRRHSRSGLLCCSREKGAPRTQCPPDTPSVSLVSPSSMSKNRATHRVAEVENKGLEPLTPSLQSWCSTY